MVAVPRTFGLRSRRRVPRVGMFGLLALSLLVATNVALHRETDESAGLEWAAIQRLDDPSLTASLGIRQRYGMFFSLRAVANDQTIIEVPVEWRGSVQERQFNDFFRPVLFGVSQISDIRPNSALPYGTVDGWFEPKLKELRTDGLTVSEGRSRPNGRQPWYRWRIIAASGNPRVLQVLATGDNDFVLLDPMVGARE